MYRDRLLHRDRRWLRIEVLVTGESRSLKSAHFNYFWWTFAESGHGPDRFERPALTAELNALEKFS